jgi:itaconate CoA-transferase
LGQADVLVQNLAPGATARIGLSYENLKNKYPGLIVCSISGYGENGPYRDKKAYDLLIQSESGFLSITGSPEEPAKAGCSVADIAAGMYAYSHILAALLQRSKTGQGSHIEISMLECMTEWMSYPLYYAMDGAEPPARTSAAHATIYPYGPFMLGDGKTIVLGIQNEREWVLFCRQVLCMPELAADPLFCSVQQRSAHRVKLHSIIIGAFAHLTIEQAAKLLDEAQIANARMNDMQDLWRHPQLAARQRWVDIDTPVGAMPALLPPGTSDTYTPRMDPVPAVGQHTRNILAGLGYDPDQIAALQADNAI